MRAAICSCYLVLDLVYLFYAIGSERMNDWEIIAICAAFILIVSIVDDDRWLERLCNDEHIECENRDE